MLHPYQYNVRLNEAISRYERRALSPATQNVYSSGSRAFMVFINLHNLQKSELGLPACHQTLLRYFVVHCSENLGLSYVTIKSYLSAVRNLYVSKGLSNPLVHPVSGEPLHQLALLCRGLKKSQSSSNNVRQPFTGLMLFKLSICLRNGLFGQYLDSLLEAACMLAFFGFLRCGEFTTITEQFDPNLNLCLGDILLTNNCVHILIKVSKTDPFRKGCSINLFHNGSPLCPYTALAKYLALRKCISNVSNTPLFLLPGGRPLSRKIFLELFRAACTKAHVNTNNISGHSLRIGAATTAAAAKTPDHLIQTLGRWQSNCYVRYIRTPKSLISQAQSNIAAHVLSETLHTTS